MKKILPAPACVAAFLLLVFALFASVPLSAASDFFLHSSTSDLLDNTSPTATTAKFKDSAAVNRTTYQQIGIWSGAALTLAQTLNSLSDLHVFVGLKNSDDQGTYFDLKAEIRKNGVPIASGETKNIQGVTRNPSLAKEAVVSFGPISDSQFNPGDILSIRILTKVADSGGHNNAVGLRLYYDAVSRPSRFGAVFVVDTDPPTIAATINPAPNAAGWHKSDVTVSFACADAGSGIASCSAPVTVTTEGANQVISGTAVDVAGNTAAASVTLSIDKTPPTIVISSPANGTTLGSSPVTVTGTITETLSGIANIGCNGNPATLSGSTFTCNVPVVSGANTIVVDATDVAGNAGSSSISVNFASGPGISITSPAPGSVFNSSTVLVRGVVDVPAGTEVGVSVNDALAAVHGNDFVALVPVTPETTSLTALATTTAGVTANQSVSISVSAAQAPSISLHVSPKSGVAPLTDHFTVISNFVPGQVELDANGDGIVDFTGTQLQEQPFTFTQPGVFVATARVTDSQGNLHTGNAIVQVYDAAALEFSLQTKWTGVKGALRTGDIAAALTMIARHSRSRYQDVFTVLAPDLPAIDTILTDLTFVRVRGQEAIFEMFRTDSGILKSFEVRFVVDTDGIWRLRMF